MFLKNQCSAAFVNVCKHVKSPKVCEKMQPSQFHRLWGGAVLLQASVSDHKEITGSVFEP